MILAGERQVIYDSSSKWADMLFDIYCVKKAHKFSFERMADYSLQDFLDDVENSESDTISSDNDFSEIAESNEFQKRANSVSLYP